MKLIVVAHRCSETNKALVRAAESLALPALVLPPRDALCSVEPADIVLCRLDAELTGIEPGLPELEQVAATGAVVLNPPTALVAAHDRHLTARLLRRAGLPHPRSWLLADGLPSPAPELPVALTPRFGRWSGDVRCETADELETALARLASVDWFRDHGVLARELAERGAPHLRLVVAGRRVLTPAPPLAHRLALAAAAALGADFAAVELVSRGPSFAVTGLDPVPEVEGARDCRAALHELLVTAVARRPAA
jgi:hypothetical protein